MARVCLKSAIVLAAVLIAVSAALSEDFLFCSLSLDSLWAFEEVDCDGQNLVQICYRASDPIIDSLFATIHASGPEGALSIHTIYETVPGFPPPNLGWVSPGVRCFYWDFGADYPGLESCGFEAELSIFNETSEILTLSDSFGVPQAEGVAWDGENLWVTRSWYSSPLDTQRVFRVNPITHEIYSDSCVVDALFDGYTADCVWHDGYLWVLGGGLSPQRAKLFKVDVSTCSIVDSSAALWGGARWGQGLCYFEGWFYACDSNGKIYRVSPTPPYTATLWLDLETIHPGLMAGAISADALVFALGSIWILRNPGPAGHVLLQFDYAGNVVDSFALASPSGFGPEGITFDGECFWYSDHSSNMVYRVCLWACEDSGEIALCLDSKAPSVNMDCPAGPLYIGDSVDFSWLTEDMFLSAEPGSLIVEAGAGRFAYSAGSSGLSLDIPELCGPTSFAVLQRDSFCNWGADTCFVDICSRFEVSVECAPCGDFSSCPELLARYFAIDMLCGSAPSSVFFTVKLFREDGDSLILRPVGPSAEVALSPFGGGYLIELSGIPLSDGDSVWIALDSLINPLGCKTRP